MSTYVEDQKYADLTAELARELIEAANRFAYRNGLPRVDLGALKQGTHAAEGLAQDLMVFGLDCWPASINEGSEAANHAHAT